MSCEFPVRCYSCNKVIGHKWKEYDNAITAGIEISAALKKVGADRYCCRRMFLGHIELIDKMLLYVKDIKGDEDVEIPEKVSTSVTKKTKKVRIVDD
jgi:DNA-directed RNA polymerase subunit N (RpoN/RPB10)